MNTCFNPTWKKNSGKDPVDRAEAVIASLEQKRKINKSALDWIQERMGSLAILKQSTSNWADPGFAMKQTSKLKNNFTKSLGFDKTGKSQNSIKAVYQESDEFGKLALLQFLRDAVNTDCIIKAVKESTSYASDLTIVLQLSFGRIS